MEQRLYFSAGALIRGAVVRELQKFLFMEGADFSLKEDRGWLESEYYLTIRGKGSYELAVVVQDWLKRNENVRT